MISATKKSVIYGALFLLTVWPLVHLALVAGFDLSPWKLAGWGMYSAPRTGAGFQVVARQAKGMDLRPIAVPPAAMEIARDFHARRRWLGELASPTSLAEAILAADPSLLEVGILVERPVLSTDTGFIEATHRMYRVRREDPT